MSAFEITLFINDAGPLTKRISLDDHGKPLSDGSACLMTRGSARRVPVDDINLTVSFSHSPLAAVAAGSTDTSVARRRA